MTKLTQMSVDNEGSSNGNGLKSRRIHLREISGDSESPLETVGQDLRAARLRRGDEIAQVSRALKIRKDHLDALEEDRLEDLPGKTYAIGFVRSYARHLGLDSDSYVERFKRDISGRHEESTREPAPIHLDEGRRLPQGWRIIAGVVAVLLIYGGYHLLSSGGDSSPTTPPAPVIVPPKPPSKPAPAPVAAPSQTATVSPAADGTPGAQANAAPTTNAPPAATPSPAAGPQSPATHIAPGTSGPTVATQTPAAAAGQPPAPSKGEIYGKGNNDPRVVLRVRADTRVTVKGSDGQLYLNRDLKAGDAYQVPNTPGLSMAVANGGAVEVDVDGKALGRAGQLGQVLGKVSLDPASLVDRFNTH
jgi:cytoskeleton protein RodZ